VGEGSRIARDQKFAQDNYIPEGCRILILSNRSIDDVQSKIWIATRAVDRATKEEIWSSFTRRFQILQLTNETTEIDGYVRCNRVQDELSVNALVPLPTEISTSHRTTNYTGEPASGLAFTIGMMEGLPLINEEQITSLLAAVSGYCKDVRTKGVIGSMLTMVTAYKEPGEQQQKAYRGFLAKAKEIAYRTS
jgi:hypothetical protein